MPLITRLSRLFQADLHGVLDRVEDPELLLRQAVREMETALASDQQRCEKMTRERQQITDRKDELQKSLATQEEELDIAFEAGQEDLARKLIRRRLESQQLAAVLERKRQDLDGRLRGLESRIRENRIRLDSMRQKVEILANEQREESPVMSLSLPGTGVLEEDVEVAYLREKRKRSRS